MAAIQAPRMMASKVLGAFVPSGFMGGIMTQKERAGNGTLFLQDPPPPREGS
jgi:hypothetical protein